MKIQSSPPVLWESLENIIQRLKNKRLADVFRFISFHAGETYGPHEHLRIEINYVKKGNCILYLDNESVNFRAGEIMIIPSGVRHTFEANSNGTTLMQLEFLPEMFSHFHTQYIDENGVTPQILFSGKNKLIKIVNNVRIIQTIQRIVNELNLKNEYYTHLVIMYYAELLILIYRHMNETGLPISTPDVLKKAISYFQLNYPKEISITDVAIHTGIGERYLRKLFSQYLNLSPLDYLRQIRINKAVELLKNTEMSVKEICFVCGFRSPQYFSRIFKQQTGTSPRDINK